MVFYNMSEFRGEPFDFWGWGWWMEEVGMAAIFFSITVTANLVYAIHCEKKIVYVGETRSPITNQENNKYEPVTSTDHLTQSNTSGS